jgi:ABC-type transporter Mla MlaB component
MRVESGIAIIEGDLVLDRITDVLAEALASIQAGAGKFDLSGVGRMDSSALSLLLELKRTDRARNAEDKPPLQFLHVPDSLTSLAALYGIADLF